MIASNDGLEIPFNVDGDGGGPCLVFAHGLMGTGASQRVQLPPLVRAGWTVVTFDQRGHGAASPVTDPSGYDPDAMAADLWAVADAAGVERCWIGGGSMGAATSWRAARLRPERVLGLIQAVPALRDEPHAAIFLFDALADRVGEDGIDGLVDTLRAFLGSTGMAVHDAFLDELRAHDAASIETALRTVPRWVLDDVPSAFASVPFPVVVIGWDGDPIHPLECAKAIAASASTDLIEIDMIVPGREEEFGRVLLDRLPEV